MRAERGIGLLLLLGVALYASLVHPEEAARASLPPRPASAEEGQPLRAPDIPPPVVPATTPGAAYLPAVYLGFADRLSPTITPLPCGEIVWNGDFEQGHVGWEEHSAGNYEIVTTAWSQPFQGSWVSWFGGYTEPLPLDVITQTLHIPEGAVDEQTLTLNLYVESNDTWATAWDFLTLRFYDMLGSPLSDPIPIADNTAAPLPWSPQEIHLTGFRLVAGQDIQVELRSTADGADITNFVVDGVSLRIACGQERALPAAAGGIRLVRD